MGRLSDRIRGQKTHAQCPESLTRPAAALFAESLPSRVTGVGGPLLNGTGLQTPPWSRLVFCLSSLEGSAAARASKICSCSSEISSKMGFVSFVGRVLFASVFLLSAYQEPHHEREQCHEFLQPALSTPYGKRGNLCYQRRLPRP
ncbi:hypothetical protein Taro_034637 [Colocasia esculenta]|uniref:Uncharacterized protein n=1 Tax=Colocasia esculenta TaxID=4460 RepID=A0A843W4J2_COLES|nr:hypothetical protein [Colocasia esculenta]